MLTPDYIAHCADTILGLYDELDRAIIADISRRIVKTGGITPTAAHQIDKVQQSGMLIADVTKQIAVVTNISEQEVQRLFNEAGITGLQNDARPLMVAGIQTDTHLSRQMEQLLKANISKTNGDLKNLTMTTGVTASDKYLEAVSEALMKVQSGAFSYDKAIRDAIKAAAIDGNYVSYLSGKKDCLDVAIRRSVLTGLNQTAAKLTEMYAADMGCEYYETSAHAGARPSHAQWQGRVFKIEGATADYPNFEDSTGYGTGAGLCGWNCRHSFYPFWPGISLPAYTKEMLDAYDAPRYEYNGEALTEYEVSQLMRERERGIRATKREIAGYQAAIDASGDAKLRASLQSEYDAASVKLRQQRAQYNDLCRQTHHPPDNTRTGVAATKGKNGQILSYGRSAAQRSRRTYERVVKTAEMRYNKGSTSEKVNLYVADEKTKKRLRSDNTIKDILPSRQEKHIPGTNNYKAGNSYLTVSMEEAQRLVNQYAGTGNIIRKSNGAFNSREVCTADHIIGVAIDPETGAQYPTHKFTIHYAKSGVHIVPARED